MVTATKSFATSSILLKQGPVEMLIETTTTTATAPLEPIEDAVEVAEHGQVVVDADPISTKPMYQSMQLYLMTHGFALASCSPPSTDGTLVVTLLQVVEWTQIHHVSPLLTMSSIQIHLRQPANASMMLQLPMAHLQPWLDAFQMVLVQNTLHSSRPHSDLGWQYALVHVSWFTLAVCGYEDEHMVRNRDLLNHLDSYNHYAPLHYAIRRANTGIVKALLDAGADPNLPNGDGHQTPMSMAYDVDDEEIVQLLLEYGAKKESRKDKTELFGRVTATQDAMKEKKEAKAREEERAAEVERIKTERVQAQMAENIRLMQERGEQINEMGDKASAMHEGASEFNSLAKQLKEKSKQQAQPFSNPFSNPFKRGKGGK